MPKSKRLSDFEKAVLLIAFAKSNLSDSDVDWLADEPDGYTRKLKNRQAGKAFLKWAKQIGSVNDLISQLDMPRLFFAIVFRQLMKEPPSIHGSPIPMRPRNRSDSNEE